MGPSSVAAAESDLDIGPIIPLAANAFFMPFAGADLEKRGARASVTKIPLLP